MNKYFIILLVSAITGSFAAVQPGFYADITDELIIPPVSASMAASNLSTGDGTSVESTPGNLPFDSSNHLSLSYAGFFGNSFNTSLVSYHGKPTEDIGVSLLLGYIYVPNIPNSTKSDSTEDGAMRLAKLSYFSASRIIVRAGIGRLFTLRPGILLGTGVAINAKRIRLPETGYGIGMDAGVKLLLTHPGISLALQLENVTSSYTYWNSSFQERAYQQCRVGIGYQREVPYLYGAIQLSYASPDLFANDGINSQKSEITPNDNRLETVDHVELYEDPLLLAIRGRYGIEYTVFNTVSFRGGFYNGDFSFGAGLHHLPSSAGIDVAYITHSLGGTYQVSINYNW